MTKEDLQQIAELIQQENAKLEQRMQEQMKQQTETITQMMDEKIQGVRDEMEDKIRGVKVLIENDIGKRIDALFDGYKLTHEKQWELEHKMELMEKRLQRVEQKVG